MNTTKLIAQWTMRGPGREVGGGLQAAGDIRDLIAGNKPTPRPGAVASSFLIKEASEGGWRALDV
jgi:hypothetical protein